MDFPPGNAIGGQSASRTKKKTAFDLFGSVIMLGVFGCSSARECMCAGSWSRVVC